MAKKRKKINKTKFKIFIINTRFLFYISILFLSLTINTSQYNFAISKFLFLNSNKIFYLYVSWITE